MENYSPDIILISVISPSKKCCVVGCTSTDFKSDYCCVVHACPREGYGVPSVSLMYDFERAVGKKYCYNHCCPVIGCMGDRNCVNHLE